MKISDGYTLMLRVTYKNNVFCINCSILDYSTYKNRSDKLDGVKFEILTFYDNEYKWVEDFSITAYTKLTKSCLMTCSISSFACYFRDNRLKKRIEIINYLDDYIFKGCQFNLNTFVFYSHLMQEGSQRVIKNGYEYTLDGFLKRNFTSLGDCKLITYVTEETFYENNLPIYYDNLFLTITEFFDNNNSIYITDDNFLESQLYKRFIWSYVFQEHMSSEFIERAANRNLNIIPLLLQNKFSYRSKNKWTDIKGRSFKDCNDTKLFIRSKITENFDEFELHLPKQFCPILISGNLVVKINGVEK